MLRRMVERKELKHQSFDFGVADLFMLPATYRLKQSDKYRHETGAANLFIAFHSLMSAWIVEPVIGSIRGDRGMQVWDKTFYFEVDRATESPAEIEKKGDAYIEYSRETGERFHVIFSIMENPRRTVEKRGEEIINVLMEKPRGSMFLIANHEKLLAGPDSYTLYNPAKDAIVTLPEVL